MKLGFLITVFALISLGKLSAQDSFTLVFDSFLQQVVYHHPRSAQADLYAEKGGFKLMKARGALDPKLSLQYNGKNYRDLNYYSILSSGVEWQSPFALKFSTGFEQNEGLFLNPQLNLPAGGLYYGEVSLPLIRGLWTDQTRTGLNQAKAGLDLYEAGREKKLNALLVEASMVYWGWYKAYYSLLAYRQNLELARTRFQLVKRNAEEGNIPFIDTVEAKIQMRRRERELIAANRDLKSFELDLQNHIWRPELLTVSVRPQSTSNNTLLDGQIEVDSNWVVQHPMYREISASQQQLFFEKRWKAEQLKPQVDLKYRPLTSAVNPELAPFNSGNYQYGVQFNFPLFLRKERAELGLTKLTLQDTRYDLQISQRYLNMELNNLQQRMDRLQQERDIALEISQLYMRLAQAERTRYEAGESALFIVNTRETNALKARLNYIEADAELRKSRVYLHYILGDLYKQYLP